MFSKCLLFSLALIATAAPIFSLSAEPAPSATYNVQIKSQPLGTALQELGAQSGIQIVFFSDITQGLNARALEGRYTIEDALRALLHETPLDFRKINPGTIEIVRREMWKSHRQKTGQTLAEVLITGTAEKLVATRIETPLREIPQTLVVVSPEQIRQQNDVDVSDVLKHATGVTLMRTTSLDQDAYVRGYQVTAFHIDGGAALSSRNLIGIPFLSKPDLSEFGRVEILRGADGLFGSDGNPGATISLIRKRPREATALTASALAGSWNQYRAEADLTGPLSEDGALRGRLDVMYTAHDYFYKTANHDRQKMFGVLEYASDPTSSFFVGGSYQWDNAVPFYGGLPSIYSDGTGADVPRNTSLTFDWASDRTRLGELYLQWDKELENGWKMKLNTTAWRASVECAMGSFGSTPNPVNRSLAGGPTATVSTDPAIQRQYAVDLTVTGAYSLFALSGEVALGADFSRILASQALAIYRDFQPQLRDIFEFDPSMYPDPRLTQRPLIEGEASSTFEQGALFAASKLRLSNQTRVVVGGRLSDTRATSNATLRNDFTSISVEDHLRNAHMFAPYAGAMFFPNDRYSLYASYADILRTEGLAARPDGRLLAPIHGVNIETGVKAAWRSGKLNGTLVFYQVNQHNVPVPIPVTTDLGLEDPPPYCCYTASSNRSRGIDVELNGAITSKWLIAAGYTYNTNESAQGGWLSSATPRHLFKLWSSEQLPGRLSRWSIGGDLHFQSDNFDTGGYCSRVSANGSCLATGSFTAIQNRFVVLGLRASYRFDAQWQLALNVNNVFDETYFETIGRPEAANWYGEPRNFTLRFDYNR